MKQKILLDTSAYLRLGNGASPFDIRCLAYGLVLGIPVVTDDRDMTVLAQEPEVKTLSTIELLHRMVSTGFCHLDQVRSTIRYWIAVDDLPGDWRREYTRLFDEPPPETAYSVILKTKTTLDRSSKGNEIPCW